MVNLFEGMEYPSGSIGPWRMDMKLKLFTKRGWRCERPGCPNRAEHLDEGIVTKGDMRGFSSWQKALAFCECNLFLLCADCNVNKAHMREWAFGQSCERYGEERVRAWYRALNLKAPKRGFL